MHPTRFTLTTKFAVASAVLFALIGVLLGHEIRDQVRARSLTSAERAAELVAHSTIGPELTAPQFERPLLPPEVALLDRHFSGGLRSAGVEELVVYDLHGVVRYANEHDEIGQTVDHDSALTDAVGGSVHSEITNHAHVGSKQPTHLLSSYVPLRANDTGAVMGVLELYLPFAPYERAANTDIRRLLILLGGGLAVLWLALFRVVSRASRTLTRQRDENQHLAMHDPLTGLANRALFGDRTAQALRAARRDHGPAAILLMDLDRFKEVNDTLGHHSGDALLIQTAARLRETLREVDTIARLGGDEFAVLLPDGDEEAARSAAKRIQRGFEETFVVDDLALDLRVSIGIAVHPEHSDTSEGLLQRADVAMYLAKEHQSGLEVYAADRDENSPGRLVLASELRRAIEDDELILHYQPKADVATGRITGVEALVRWQHPERGLVPPLEFIPLAEKTGLIKPLTAHVLDRAVAQCAAWQEAGIDLPVAVNLSPVSLIDRQLPSDVSTVLRRHGLAPAMLELEVTESSLMHDPVRASEILADLSAMGVAIAIDDFGTGYSSLGWLRQLPIDELKIDRSFVAAMTSRHEDQVIVASTIQLAKNLELRVVAEGVEDPDVVDALRGLGCDTIQGFLLTRPLPAADLVAWLTERDAQRFRLRSGPGRRAAPLQARRRRKVTA
ncbi:MAG: hypothetical protein QOJ09_75 [Actinomycetota bacterium]|nr:hypothetical protein [Actinomycetota bacterium]